MKLLRKLFRAVPPPVYGGTPLYPVCKVQLPEAHESRYTIPEPRVVEVPEADTPEVLKRQAS